MKTTRTHTKAKSVFTALLCFLVAAPATGQQVTSAQQQMLQESNAQVFFIENKGQVKDQHWQPRPDVLYSGHADGLTWHLKATGLHYQLTRVDSWKEEDELFAGVQREGAPSRQVPDEMGIYRVDVEWLGANPRAHIITGEALPGYDNYYNVPEGVVPALFVKRYASITYEDIYEGIDLHFYEGPHGGLEYDFIVHPGADYRQIRMAYEGADIQVNGYNELVLSTPFGEIIEGALKVFQEGKELPGRWKVMDGVVSFDVEGYNPALTLLIDPPVRVWGTYYGGSGLDQARSTAIDGSGHVYLAGRTNSITGIATTGAHQTANGGGFDAFMAKFDGNGARQWGTYYGGSGYDQGYSTVTDGSGNVYLAGETSSITGIATTGAHQTAYGGGTRDAFLAKFNGNGVRQWGTYYGGSGSDVGGSTATDGSGNVYLAGWTSSTTGIVTTGAHQTANGGGTDAFLAKFNGNGVRQWGTYYGGSASDQGFSTTTDGSGHVYLAGSTKSTTGIATTGAHQTAHGGGIFVFNAFLAKFNGNGVRQWGTYYGGSSGEISYSTATDGSGNVYLAGLTLSTTGIATTGAHQTAHGGFDDAFLAKFDGNGVRQWGTYYGGSGWDYGLSTATDGSGNVYLAGYTTSTTGIATTGAHQTVFGGLGDVFLAKFDGNGARQWGTYYGGSGEDSGESTATDGSGHVYLAGWTESTTGIATTGAHQTAYGGGTSDAFLVKFSDGCAPTSSTIHPIACDSFVSPSGNYVWTTSGTFTDTIPNAEACDSIITIHLTIQYSNTGDTTVAACGSYTWFGNTYIVSGAYNEAGCDSTITLYLTILQHTADTLTETACGAFTLNGTPYTSTGTYTQTLANVAGCDSTITLHLTILKHTADTLTETACESFTLNGTTYNASGTYTQTLANVAGCDSTITLHLTILKHTADTLTETACGAFTLNGIAYTSTGTYTQTLANVAGCDSTITLHLTILKHTADTLTEIACGSFTLNGTPYTSSGTYTQTLTNVAGCDSTITLHLTILIHTADTLTETACGAFTLNGTTYNASGTYTQTLANVASCDSTITLHLTILEHTAETLTDTACGAFTLNGIAYTSTGTYTQTLANVASCDSTITLHLTILEHTAETLTDTACGAFTLNGTTYTSTGTYTLTLANAAGCDSTITIHLTIHPNPVVTLGNDTLTHIGAQVTLDAGNPGATYLWSTGATTQTITVDAHGTYSVTVTDANGCEGIDSITITGTGINTVEGLGKWSVFPNPTDGDTHIRLELFRGGKVAIELYDPSGRRVWEQAYSNATGTETISIPMQGLAQGMYLVRVRLDGQLIGTSAVGKL